MRALTRNAVGTALNIGQRPSLLEGPLLAGCFFLWSGLPYGRGCVVFMVVCICVCVRVQARDSRGASGMSSEPDRVEIA